MNHLSNTITVIHSDLVLHEIASKSLSPQFDFTEALLEIEQLFLDSARTKIPVMHQSSVLSHIRYEFNQLENYCKGIQLLGVLPPMIQARFKLLPEQLIEFIELQSNAYAYHSTAVRP